MRPRHGHRGSARAGRSPALALLRPELLAAFIVAGALAVLLLSARPAEGKVELTAGAGGALALSNSREGSAVLALGGMRPGDVANGTVTIGNTGTITGELTLSTSGLADLPGPGGGVLSDKLELLVEDVSGGGPVTVYTGTVADFGTVALGALPAGESRNYAFRVTFPDAGPGAENAYQGSTLTVQFDWSATADDATPPETTVVSGPASVVASGDAELAFEADEAGSSFECSLDGAPFTACSSPVSLTGLADGSHTFAVRAADEAGNVEDTPAEHAWTVDTTAPAASLADPGAALRGTVELEPSATDAGSGVDSLTVELAPAGSGSWEVVAESLDTRAYPDGSYDLRARAADAAGNVATSGVRTTIFDNTAARLSSSDPADGTVVPTADGITLVADEALAAVRNAKLDGSPAPAGSVSGASVTYTSSFAEGPHVLTGELEDAAGNRRPFRVHFTVWSSATTDYPYVEKNAPSAGTTLGAANGEAGLTVPAGAWTGAPAGDWLVVRVDPRPGSLDSGWDVRGDVLDVTAYWALAGGSVTAFAKPLELTLDDPAGAEVPATFEGGAWRRLEAAANGQALSGGQQDGYYRADGKIVLLTRHLTAFALVSDVEAPTKPVGFTGSKSNGRLLLSWKAASDNDAVTGYEVYANGTKILSLGRKARSADMGAFSAGDTRKFQVAAVDGWGNTGPKSKSLVVVPAVNGSSLATATALLEARGLTVAGTVAVPSSLPAGQVVGIRGAAPVAGEGASVTLEISKAADPEDSDDGSDSGESASGGGGGSSGTPTYPYGFGAPSTEVPQTFGDPGTFPPPAAQAAPPAVPPATGSNPDGLEVVPSASPAQGDGQGKLGVGLLLLALLVGGYALARALVRHRRSLAPAADDLVLWDQRVGRAALSTVRRLLGRA